jgi:ribosomal protein S3AE
LAVALALALSLVLVWGHGRGTGRQVKLCIEEVQGRNCLTDFHGMSLTRDKQCALIRKWHTMIEATRLSMRTSVLHRRQPFNKPLHKQ